jgi:hypothetical protein
VCIGPARLAHRTFASTSPVLGSGCALAWRSFRSQDQPPPPYSALCCLTEKFATIATFHTFPSWPVPCRPALQLSVATVILPLSRPLSRPQFHDHLMPVSPPLLLAFAPLSFTSALTFSESCGADLFSFLFGSTLNVPCCKVRHAAYFVLRFKQICILSCLGVLILIALIDDT